MWNFKQGQVNRRRLVVRMKNDKMSRQYPRRGACQKLKRMSTFRFPQQIKEMVRTSSRRSGPGWSQEARTQLSHRGRHRHRGLVRGNMKVQKVTDPEEMTLMTLSMRLVC